MKLGGYGRDVGFLLIKEESLWLGLRICAVCVLQQYL